MNPLVLMILAFYGALMNSATAPSDHSGAGNSRVNASLLMACPDAGKDTLVCGFTYQLEGSENGGNWRVICSDTTDGNVMLSAPGFDTTMVKVDRCGTYTFVYDVPSGPCAGSDTVRVRFEDPSSAFFNYGLETLLILNAECHASPSGPICDNTVTIEGFEPPSLDWEFCGNLNCNSTIMAVQSGQIVDSCLAQEIICDTLLYSDFQIQCTAPDFIDGSNILDIINGVLDIDAACPLPLQCFTIPEECIDTLIDTLYVEIPVIEGGLWHYVDEAGQLIPLDDTSFLVINGQEYAFVIQPGSDYYGPEALTFIIWQVVSPGNWVKPTFPVQLSIQWVLDIRYDSLELVDTIYQVNDSSQVCGGVTIDPATVTIPEVPDYPCGPVDLFFDVPDEDIFFVEQLNCLQPNVIVEVCPGIFEFYSTPGFYTFNCDFNGCPYSAYIEIFEDFTQPVIEDVVVTCGPENDTYDIAFIVTGGSDQVFVNGLGAFNYGESIQIQGIPSCSSFNIEVSDVLSFCTDDELVFHCCCNNMYVNTEAVICEGEQYDFNGQLLQLPGDYEQILISSDGCDSIVTLTLGIMPSANTVLDTAVCSGSSFFFGGEQIAEAGTYTDSLISADGCDSIVVLILSIKEISFTLTGANSCMMQDDGQISIESITGGTTPYGFSIDGISFQPVNEFSGLSPGVYNVIVSDASGCTAEDSIEIREVPPINVNLPQYYSLCDGDSLFVDVTQAGADNDSVSYTWNNGYSGPVRHIAEPGEYSVSITSACESQVYSFALDVTGPDLASRIYVPNVFSPNGDGVNDEFRVFTAVVLLEFELHVYDRWGDELIRFESTDDFWDGSFLDKAMNPGVYVWWLKARGEGCNGSIQDVVMKGDVTIVK